MKRYREMSVAELKEACDAQGIEYTSRDRKADLVRYLEKYGEPIEVEAVTIDDEMVPMRPFAIDLDAVRSDVEALTKAIDDALTVYGDVQVDEQAIQAMDASSLAICEKQLSDALKEADEARLALGRNLTDPKKEIDARFKELTEPAFALREAYRERRTELLREGLEATYSDFCIANGMETLPQVVPFQRLLDSHKQWMRLDASAGNSARKVEETAKQIIDDWGALAANRSSMRFYDEAEACFFRTLDLKEALRLNQERTEQQERIEAARAEREANEAWQRQQLPLFEEVEPEPAPAKEQAAEPVSQPQRKRYRFEAWLSDSEVEGLRGFARANGTDWAFKEVTNG